jgi:hypothetical protein
MVIWQPLTQRRQREWAKNRMKANGFSVDPKTAPARQPASHHDLLGGTRFLRREQFREFGRSTVEGTIEYGSRVEAFTQLSRV